VQHPLCAFCVAKGLVTAAVVVDHIEAHDGDYEKFWDSENWQSLCKRHHDSTKQRQEKKRLEGGGGQKVHDPSSGTGAPAKFLRPRNSSGGSND
jgi:5-methylcytosine-specific restriction endonuclease McrA